MRKRRLTAAEGGHGNRLASSQAAALSALFCTLVSLKKQESTFIRFGTTQLLYKLQPEAEEAGVCLRKTSEGTKL